MFRGWAPKKPPYKLHSVKTKNEWKPLKNGGTGRRSGFFLGAFWPVFRGVLVGLGTVPRLQGIACHAHKWHEQFLLTVAPFRIKIFLFLRELHIPHSKCTNFFVTAWVLLST